jgi:hypothetical protein
MAELDALFRQANEENDAKSAACVPAKVAYNNSTGDKYIKAKETLSIQEQAVASTRNDYATCLGIKPQVAIAMARADIDKYNADAEGIKAMTNTLLAQLQKDVQIHSALEDVSDITQDQAVQLQTEIDQLKASIRKERRIFLDSDPSAPTATAGLYYTKEPDNQLLIAFIICFACFLTAITALLMTNHIPIDYFTKLSMNERISFTAVLWIASLLVTYVGFFTFT